MSCANNSGARDEQDGRTLAPRYLKDVMEERLFAKRRDLFSKLDLVFMDTTRLHFEGGGQTLGRHGFSKDHRPDLHQMILAVLLDGNGRPVCTEMWPGNTADTASARNGTCFSRFSAADYNDKKPAYRP
ncbi:MAG TPA: hypothetical protein VGY99_24085 [Candidatus Binataceae bacterium]|nr:hypothetical protein [Candidatus Binataceae bacterium]